MNSDERDRRRDSRRPSMRRAAVAASIAGPLGVLAGLLTALPLLPVTAVFVIAGALVAALTCPEDSSGDAAVLAILPIGTWLVGAAVGWAGLALLADAYPLLDRYSFILTLLAAIVGGTLSVTLVVTHFHRPTLEE